MAFHRLQDGATLARLDPYADGEQVWLLHSGRDIAVTAAEVRNISKQVHGLDLPETRPEGGTCNCGARMDEFERRLAALEAQAAPTLNQALEESIEANPDLFDEAPADPAVDPRDAELEALRARVAELEASPPPSPAVVALEGMEALRAKIDAVRAGKDEMTPDELLQMYRDEPPGAAGKLEDAVRALKGEARRKLSELLNVELAELKNLRGMAGEDRVREQQIEYLLGLFTRLGEI